MDMSLWLIPNGREHPGKGGGAPVQYAQMVDLIGKTKLTGVWETDSVRKALTSAFETWLNRQDLREITDEEFAVLHAAFAEGFTNDYKV
jgi:hypothetical protein